MTPEMRKGRTPTSDPTTERHIHTTEGNPAFAFERSAGAATPRRSGDLVPAGQLLVPVMREIFAKADALEGGER